MIGSMFANDEQSRHRPGRALNIAQTDREEMTESIHSGE
jgi:hypothetical protein